MAGKKNTIRQDNFRIRYEKGTSNKVERIMVADGKKSFAWAVKTPDGFKFVPDSGTELRSL